MAGLALRVFVVSVVLGCAVGFAPAVAAAATFTVNSTADPGDGICDAEQCTLREAILASNASIAKDTIAFAIGGGAKTITPLIDLPATTDPVVIDGTTQPGYAGIPLINVDGHFVPETIPTVIDGLVVGGGTSTVRGLRLTNFGAGRALSLTGAGGDLVTADFFGTNAGGTGPSTVKNGTDIYIDVTAPGNTIGGVSPADRNLVADAQIAIDFSSTDNAIVGNYVGTDISGGVAIPSFVGLANRFGSDGNTIGGAEPGAGNLLSGNQRLQLDLAGDHNVVQGNLIGVDITGTNPLGSGVGLPDDFDAYGMEVDGNDNLVGGTTAAARNVISGNRDEGIELGSGSRNVLEGNFIGTDITGTKPLPNTRNGILYEDRDMPNLITSNVIAFNGEAGIAVNFGGGGSFLANSIRDNGGLGIDLTRTSFGQPNDGPTPNDGSDGDDGPNDLQNFPLLTQAVSGRITGTLNSVPKQTYRIEVFTSAGCEANGRAEGSQFVAATTATTDAVGNAAFSISAAVPVGTTLTATATAPDGSTSEFSPCATAQAPAIAPPPPPPPASPPPAPPRTPPRCVVPVARGKTLARAKAALRARHCRAGAVARKHSSVKAGRVISQSRRPGSRLASGARVGLVVSLGPRAVARARPRFTG